MPQLFHPFVLLLRRVGEELIPSVALEEETSQQREKEENSELQIRTHAQVEEKLKMASFNKYSNGGFSGGPPSKKIKVGGAAYTSRLQVNQESSAASQEGEEKKNNGSYRISKRWYLNESGLSLTLCYDNGEEIAAFLGNLKEYCSGVKTPLLKLARHVVMTILNEWGMFHQMYNGRQPCTMVIPTEYDEKKPETTMILGTFDGVYGMKVVNHVPFEGDVELFLNVECLEKITKARKFMAEHFEYLLENLESYTLMHREIRNRVERMIGDEGNGDRNGDASDGNVDYNDNEDKMTTKMLEATEMIAKLDLKKDIIDAFQSERKIRELSCDINVYSLFSLCMCQIRALP